MQPRPGPRARCWARSATRTGFVAAAALSAVIGLSANGQLAAGNAPLFDLDGSTLSAPTTDADGSAVLDGTTVELSDEAAALLNSTFATDALAGGLVIGTSTITVQTS